MIEKTLEEKTGWFERKINKAKDAILIGIHFI